ncbi:MAG: hypothetical protein IKZ10_07215 [Akkermansia sp.]|nr:hypothetical protein [Akkermansia sp.]
MKKTLFVAVMAALPVFAQAEMPKTKDIPVPAPGMEQPRHWGAAGEMPGRPSREDMQKKMLEKFDADKDGQLSDAEKEAIKAGMKGKRPNFDGKRPEFDGKKGERPSREDMQKKMLEKFDADKDGQLSDAEKEAMKAARPQHGRGQGKGKGRGNKGPRGQQRGQAPQGADVPVTLSL